MHQDLRELDSSGVMSVEDKVLMYDRSLDELDCGCHVTPFPVEANRQDKPARAETIRLPPSE